MVWNGTARRRSVWIGGWLGWRQLEDEFARFDQPHFFARHALDRRRVRFQLLHLGRELLIFLVEMIGFLLRLFYLKAEPVASDQSVSAEHTVEQEPGEDQSSQREENPLELVSFRGMVHLRIHLTASFDSDRL